MMKDIFFGFCILLSLQGQAKASCSDCIQRLTTLWSRFNSEETKKDLEAVVCSELDQDECILVVEVYWSRYVDSLLSQTDLATKLCDEITDCDEWAPNWNCTVCAEDLVQLSRFMKETLVQDEVVQVVAKDVCCRQDCEHYEGSRSLTMDAQLDKSCLTYVNRYLHLFFDVIRFDLGKIPGIICEKVFDDIQGQC